VGISSANPHETSLVHLGETKYFKGLVAYAKCNRDSYESELGIVWLLFLVLLEDEQKVGVGVFLRLLVDPVLAAI